jgi:hypothetical protein
MPPEHRNSKQGGGAWIAHAGYRRKTRGLEGLCDRNACKLMLNSLSLLQP